MSQIEPKDVPSFMADVEFLCKVMPRQAKRWIEYGKIPKEIDETSYVLLSAKNGRFVTRLILKTEFIPIVDDEA